jgi:hypothetical protein
VYAWVAPENGVKQGRFEPAVFLVTPKKQQVLTLGLDYALTKNTQLTVEGAMSNYDVNLFSSRDKENDKGFATKLQLKNTKALGGKKIGWRLITDLGYEWVESKFKPLERLRNVEFTRDWGLPLQTAPTDEAILQRVCNWLMEKPAHSAINLLIIIGEMDSMGCAIV